MISKEEFERIDEEYAKFQQKAGEEAWGFPKVYEPVFIEPYNSPLPIRPHQPGRIKPLEHKFKISDEQIEEINRLMGPDYERTRQKLANMVLSTDNPNPYSWLQQFIFDEMKQESKDRIIFKFGEFIGNLTKEENLSYSQIIGVLLEFVENNLKKK